MELARFVEAWLELARVDLAIRFLPYRRWRHWLESEGEVRPSSAAPVAFCVRAVERAARRHYADMNCLRRSLALRRLLARRGVPSRLHLGVRPQGGEIEAHAWVSSGGTVLNDTADVAERYAELGREGWEEALARNPVVKES